MSKPIVIDLFCGAGGESQGIHWAAEQQDTNIELFAINHWERAIETHSKNFPHDECVCRDIEDIDPHRVVPHGKVALLWASPACTHFSVARGGKPMDEQSRVTPFTVLDWLDKLTVDRLIIENVPEFQSWGPLNKDNRPIKSARGDTFNAFITMLRSLGYIVDWRVLNAADYGAPTTRRRLFIQGVRKYSGKRIAWPRQTNFSPETEPLFSQGAQWIPAKDIIDWSIPCPLIDERKRPLVKKTIDRIMQGIKKYWGDGAKPFITRYNGGENRNHNIDDPMPVLDTSNRYGLVRPIITSIGQTSAKNRSRSIEEPLPTICTKQEHCLVEPLLMEYYGNGQCKPITEPCGTVTTKDRFALINPESIRLGFRMLQPHELAAAQSFPKDYKFTGTKTEVVKQIGNAVCPMMAKALVEAGGME